MRLSIPSGQQTTRAKQAFTCPLSGVWSSNLVTEVETASVSSDKTCGWASTTRGNISGQTGRLTKPQGPIPAGLALTQLCHLQTEQL